MAPIKTMLVPLVISLLAGCAGGEHIYTSSGTCLTCINNPLTGEPINHDGSAPGSTMANRKGAATVNETTAGASEITATPVAQTQTQTQTSEPRLTEFSTKFSVATDVDRAFLQIKREFQYLTEQEIRQLMVDMAANFKVQSFSYAYDATPSVYYHMRDYREHGPEHYIIDHLIEKQSPSATDITITVWVNETSPLAPRDVAASLAARTRRVLTP